jgi:hypothetical protein
MNTMLDHAIDYARRGYYVFPCAPFKKNPIVKNGFLSATTDQEQIREWWKQNPKANIGIRTGAESGIIVLDEDEHDAIKNNGFCVPATAKVSTQKGYHYYFKHPGKPVRNKVKFAPGLDTRGDGGYVVAPPSVYVSGEYVDRHGVPTRDTHEYEWAITPDELGIADCPDWLLEELDKGSKRAPVELASKIPNGTRNGELLRRAGTLTRAGVDPQTVRGFLHYSNENFCETPLERDEVDGITIYENASNETVENKQRGLSAMELLKKEFKPLRWALPGVIVEGTSLFVGAPKMGKSWIALQLCLAVATGTTALGKVQAEQGDVLYLALEDNFRRLQDRLKVLGAMDLPGVERLTLETEWPRVNEGGAEEVEDWIRAHPQARLIVVDTLMRMKPQSKPGRNQYDVDYESVQRFTDITKQHNIAIVVIHHTNTQSYANDWFLEISGSNGLPAGVDSAILLRGERGGQHASLLADGRDFPEGRAYTLTRTTKGVWQVSDEDAATLNMSPERRKIIQAMREAGKSVGPSEAAELTDMDRDNVKALMPKMAKDGQINKDEYQSGKYRLPVTDYFDYHGYQDDEEAVTTVTGNHGVEDNDLPF